jgi:hypothetical protein
MEEILASIRRIIADDDTSKPPAMPTPPPPRPAAMPPRASSPPQPVAAQPEPPPSMGHQHDVDALLAGLDAPPGGAVLEEDPQDILDLTEAMAAPDPDDTPPSFQTIDGQADVVFTEAPAQPDPAPRPLDEVRPQHTPSNGSERPLLSPNTSAAVDSAFNTLAQTVLVHNARTLEDLVREMLRPLLKSWLDDNLPGMVERIVKAEIERVSRGRG